MNEPYLKFSFLAAADGNNSLKSVADEYKSGSVRDDDRMAHDLNDRWISPEDVDLFKDEVTNSQKVCNSHLSLAFVPLTVYYVATTQHTPYFGQHAYIRLCSAA
jgi:hypothetical protein